LSGRGDACGRAHDEPAGDDDAEVDAAVRDERLDEGAVPAVPGAALEARERPLQLLPRLAAEDVLAGGAEARLHHVGRLEPAAVLARSETDGGRMRNAGLPERLRSRELVVGGPERGRPVQDEQAALLQPRERAEPPLDPVEAREDVEPSQYELVRPHPARGHLRREHPRPDADRGAGTLERDVRRRHAAGDEEGRHEASLTHARQGEVRRASRFAHDRAPVAATPAVAGSSRSSSSTVAPRVTVCRSASTPATSAAGTTRKEPAPEPVRTTSDSGSSRVPVKTGVSTTPTNASPAVTANP